MTVGAGDDAVLADIAAPAEPDAFALLQRGVDGDGEAARLTRALGIGNAHPIRDENQTRRHASSHFTESRIAELMIAAIE